MSCRCRQAFQWPCSGLMGNSMGEQTDSSHFLTRIMVKHIWLHLYLSKCDLSPHLLFGLGPIQSHFLRCNIIFVLTTVQMDVWVDRTIKVNLFNRGFSMSSHLYLVICWNIACESKCWLNLVWTWFCITACDFTRCFTSNEQTNLKS